MRNCKRSFAAFAEDDVSSVSTRRKSLGTGRGRHRASEARRLMRRVEGAQRPKDSRTVDTRAYRATAAIQRIDQWHAGDDGGPRAVSGVAKLVTVRQIGKVRKTAGNTDQTGSSPSADYIVEHPRHAVQELTSAPEWKIIYGGRVDDVALIVSRDRTVEGASSAKNYLTGNLTADRSLVRSYRPRRSKHRRSDLP